MRLHKKTLITASFSLWLALPFAKAGHIKIHQGFSSHCDQELSSSTVFFNVPAEIGNRIAALTGVAWDSKLKARMLDEHRAYLDFSPGRIFYWGLKDDPGENLLVQKIEISKIWDGTSVSEVNFPLRNPKDFNTSGFALSGDAARSYLIRVGTLGSVEIFKRVSDQNPNYESIAFYRPNHRTHEVIVSDDFRTLIWRDGYVVNWIDVSTGELGGQSIPHKLNLAVQFPESYEPGEYLDLLTRGFVKPADIVKIQKIEVSEDFDALLILDTSNRLTPHRFSNSRNFIPDHLQYVSTVMDSEGYKPVPDQLLWADRIEHWLQWRIFPKTIEGPLTSQVKKLDQVGAIGISNGGNRIAVADQSGDLSIYNMRVPDPLAVSIHAAPGIRQIFFLDDANIATISQGGWLDSFRVTGKKIAWLSRQSVSPFQNTYASIRKLLKR